MTPSKPRKIIHLVKYLMVLTITAVVVVVILALLGPAIGNVFSNIVNGL